MCSRRSSVAMTQIMTGGREGVEALAAACAGGHVDKVVSLLAEGECPPNALFRSSIHTPTTSPAANHHARDNALVP